jgi:hypothetical protein
MPRPSQPGDDGDHEGMIHSRSGAVCQHVVSPRLARSLQQAGNANGVVHCDTDGFGNRRRHGPILEKISHAVNFTNGINVRTSAGWAVGFDDAGGFAVSETAFLCCASHSAASISGVVTERLTGPLPNCRPKVRRPQNACPKPASYGEKAKSPVRKAGGFAMPRPAYIRHRRAAR